MTNTPVLDIPEIAESQASKYITHNDGLRRIEALEHGVKSRTTAAEPGSPADGDSYILPASPTGTSWATYAENDLVYYSASAWKRITPDAAMEGVSVWVNDTDETVLWDGTAWGVVGDAGGVQEVDDSGDPNYASVVLNVDFDGADTSTTATDTSDSAHTLTFQGSAQITSNELDVSGSTTSLVTAPDSADWHFGSGDFTIDIDVTWTSASNPANIKYIISQYETSGNQRSWSLSWDTSRNLTFTTSTNGTTGATRGIINFVPTVSQKYRIRVDKASNVYRIYIDGVFQAKNTTSETLFNSTGTLMIGGLTSVTGRQPPATIDNVRITKGLALTGSDLGYVSGTGAYPTSLGGGLVTVSSNPLRLPSYTVATLPSAISVEAGTMAYVSDEIGGATPAFSDGTDWRRVSDRAVVA